MLARTALGGAVATHRLSKNVTLYTNELAPASGRGTPASEDHKPLMLMLPWLGSRPQAMTKYCEIYFRTGFDVLAVESEVCAPETHLIEITQIIISAFYKLSE